MTGWRVNYLPQLQNWVYRFSFFSSLFFCSRDRISFSRLILNILCGKCWLWLSALSAFATWVLSTPSLWSIEDRIQGFMYSRQVLCQLSNLFSPYLYPLSRFCFVIFLKLVFNYILVIPLSALIKQECKCLQEASDSI